MNLQLGLNIIASYKRLSYTPWYALAEFVDNSTQAYFDNKAALNDIYQNTEDGLTIKINYYPQDNCIVIEDNSIGMNREELEKALIVGDPPAKSDGRSKYGLGMKTAACWLGNSWSIRTKKLGEGLEHEVKINVESIVANNDSEVEYLSREKDIDEHYTIITITELNRQFQSRTLGKIRNFLRSMYRMDFKGYGLKLYWQDDLLTWEDQTDKLYITENNKPFKQQFEFQVNGKTVKGWVGVLGKGSASRKNAGFSIIQSNRVIEGWPDSFKPSTVFGDQEDGRNDLINQRVVGELFLDGFAVSHTKDKILWQDDELDLLEEELGRVCQDAKHLATTIRFNKDRTATPDIYIFRDEAVVTLETELLSSEFMDYLNTIELPSERIISESYIRFKESIIQSEPFIGVTIGEGASAINVQLYFNEVSEFEPYVLIEATTEANNVIVIVNLLHPHSQEMKNSDSFLNFIRHCVYDGVSEWKAIRMIGEIKPNTVKFIKDGLLRLPYDIKRRMTTSTN